MASKNIQRIFRMPIIGKFFLVPYRWNISSKQVLPKVGGQIKWLFQSNETTNFTYDLEELNRKYLINFVANVTDVSYDSAKRYIEELENDLELKNHLESMIKVSWENYKADEVVKYGRRLGWYAIIRIKKPKVVIETGIDKGMGSCIITAALKKNKEEGHPGKYYGTDINPKAGYLFTAPYNEFGEILYGDSIESLKKFDKQIDLFINDSDHSARYEGDEYEVVREKLSKDAILLGDNAHITDELLNFSQKEKMQFFFYKEKPKDHWHQGAGIGIAKY